MRGKRGKQVPVLCWTNFQQMRLKHCWRLEKKLVLMKPTPICLQRPRRDWKTHCNSIKTIIDKIKDLENPERIRSTKLRKYISTVTQISALNDTEMEWLWNHMGHSIQIHKQYYRLQDSAIELSKVSRLLLAIDSGKGASLQGKKLEEINENGSF